MYALIRIAGLVAAVAALATPAGAADPSPPKKITTIEGITEYRLDNGLQVLLFPDASTSRVTVNLTVFVGSRHEGYGETGMAHLLEHMVFKGTPKHPDVPKALRDHGAQFNGSTWVDRTNYYETMSGSDENLEFAIRLEADRLVNSFIKREDLASEMTVVRNEFEQGENDPAGILSQRMMAVAYEWHNYGKSTIGNRSDIERVPIDNLKAFYKKHYQPDNCMLVIAGKFDPDKAMRYVQQYFGVLPRPERRLDATYTEEPAQDGERTVMLRRVGSIGVVGAVYHICAGAHEDYPAVEVLSQILDAEPSGRLYQALVAAKKATRVNSFSFGWHDPGVLEIQAQVDANKPLEEVRDTMIKVLEDLPKDKFTDEEVTRAKRQLLKDHEDLLKSSNRVAVTLSEWAANGDWRLFFLHRDRLEKVTPADVARVAGRYLQPCNRTVGLYVPTTKAERTPIPATPSVPELLKDYKSTKVTALGEGIDPDPLAIEKRVRRLELPSGVKAALLPKKTRGEAVNLQLTLRYGNPESLKGQSMPVQLLGSLMTRGTKQHTRQQLKDRLDALGARVSTSPPGRVPPGELTFAVQCKRASLAEVLTLLGEMLREPTFPEAEFDVLKRQLRDQLVQSKTEPSALASRALRRILNPYPKDDVRYTPTIDESLARVDALTLDDVKKLYQTQLAGTTGELAAVGDFDAEALPGLVQKFLDGWKSAVPYRRIPSEADRTVKGERVVIETPDKANAFYMAALMLPLKDEDADHAALEVGNFLFGGGSLASRLGYRVREKEGLSYGVASQYEADSRDPAARFMMYAICNPENMPKVNRSIADELRKLLADGVGEKELDEAKKAYLAEARVDRSTEAALTSILASELEVGRTMQYYADLEKKVAALTADEVNAALRRHLDPKRLVIVEAGDFKAKAATRD